MKWHIQSKKKKSVVETLLKNRGIKTKKDREDFLNPQNPMDIPLEQFGVAKTALIKVLERLETAFKNKERIVIFGDYDADGVCSTAILWETLYSLGFDVMPYIPDRFREGYGLKAQSLALLKEKNPNIGLIITVDNGVVAYDGIDEAGKLGIDTIVVDHHLKGEKDNSAKAIFHSTLVCGSALSWILSREILKEFRTQIKETKNKSKTHEIERMLELAAIGTVADQMPLLGVNRSIVLYGLLQLKDTKRLGLKSLFKEAMISNFGVYEIGFLIAPRINAMGRLAHALDSLRLVCTRDIKKATELSQLLNQTNLERQRIVDQVIKEIMSLQKDGNENVLIVKGEYHEGVIGLASGKITEKFYRPSIVLSLGEKVSKASARSIQGFNIIEAIKKTGLIIEGGGHPMAAGFSIETSKIEEFSIKINELSKELITDEILEKKLIVDMEIDFGDIDKKLINDLKMIEPTGYGNARPLFVTHDVKVGEIKTVGADGKHLKLKLIQNNKKIDAIAFGMAENNLKLNDTLDIVYSLEENTWNGHSSIQLKVKDIKFI